MAFVDDQEMSGGLVKTDNGIEWFSAEALGLDEVNIPRNLNVDTQFVLLSQDEAGLYHAEKARVIMDLGQRIESALPLEEDGFVFEAPSLKVMKVSVSVSQSINT